jgi:hypothetical protein
MSHPIPNLSVNPIYSIGWILLAVWLITIVLITWRYYRLAQSEPVTEQKPWQVDRVQVLIVEGEVVRPSEASAPYQLAEPQPPLT